MNRQEWKAAVGAYRAYLNKRSAITQAAEAAPIKTWAAEISAAKREVAALPMVPWPIGFSRAVVRLPEEWLHDNLRYIASIKRDRANFERVCPGYHHDYDRRIAEAVKRQLEMGLLAYGVRA